MRTKASRWAPCGVLLAGVLILVSGFWMSGKAALAQLLLENSWSEAQQNQSAKPPWPGMDARPLARLSVPSLGQSSIVLDQASGQALAFGPAFMSATAPLGRPGVSAIAAHKNTHFAFLKDLKAGQSLEIETITGDILTYTVKGARILNTDTEDFVIPETAAMSELALITCYPFDAVSFGGPLRYIVSAQLSERVMGDVAAAEPFGPDNGLINGFIGQLNSLL